MVKYLLFKDRDAMVTQPRLAVIGDTILTFSPTFPTFPDQETLFLVPIC